METRPKRKPSRKSEKMLSEAKFSRAGLLTFCLIFAAVGGILLYKSFASNPNLTGDLNNDNVVNASDLSILLSDWATTNAAADINNDGTVNIFDLSILLSDYGNTYTPPSGGGSTGNGIGAIEEGDHFNVLSNPSRYSMVIVSQDDASAACAVPSPTRDLIYESGVDVNTGYSNGVDWNTANTNGWLLKDSGGSYLINQGYTSNYIGDVGSSGYQQAFINGVSALMSAHNCHAIFIDDVLRDIEPLAGEYPAKYPNQASWQAAMASFVSAIGPALKADGIYVAINASGYTHGDGGSDDGTLDNAWWQQLGPSVSGLVNEYYQETSDGSNTLRLSGSSSWTQYWDGWEQLIDTAQSMNRDFIGLTYGSSGTDYKTMRYGKGSFLLDWNGGTSVFVYAPQNGPGGSTDPWNTNWTTDMGQPSGAKTQVSTGVWKRAYANGVVIVNTSGSSTTVSGHTIASGDAYIGP